MLEPYEINPYQRINELQSRGLGQKEGLWKGIKWFVRLWIKPRSILFMVIGFVLARAIVAEQLAPFGLAFLLAIMLRFRPLVLPVAIIIIFGEITSDLTMPLWLNPFAYPLIILTGSFIGKRSDGFFRLSFMTFILVFCIKAGLLTVFSEPLVYDYLGLALEAVIVASLLPSFLIIVGLIQQPRSNFGIYQGEIGSLLLVVIGLLLGLNTSFGGYNLSVILSKYLVMFSALGGVGWGAAFGAICGLVPGLAQFNGLILAGIYSVSGMLAGFLKSWGKLGVIFGFFCGNLLYGLYFTEQTLLVDFLITTGLASFFFLFTPRRLIELLSKKWLGLEKKKEDLPGNLVAGLQELIGLLETLAAKYGQTAATIEEQGYQEKLIKKLINKVCHDCPLSLICWGREGNLFYKYFLDWLNRLEKDKTEYPEELMPLGLKKRCRRPVELTSILAHWLAIERTNGLWHQKLARERKSIGIQLKGIVKILEAASEKWKRVPKRDFHGEEALYLALEELHLYPEKLEVWFDGKNELDIYLELETPREEQEKYLSLITNSFAQTLNMPIILKSKFYKGFKPTEVISLRFSATSKNNPEIGFGKWPRDGFEISGDVVQVTSLGLNRWLCLLSDGMGSGEQAFKESSSVVLLLEQFLTLGFNLKEAIEILNTLTFMDEEERFATVDLFILDEEKGQLEFVKIGAAPSLLISNGKIEVLESNSQPMGILEEITPETKTLTLEPEAILVMVSDGVWQGPKNANREGWLPDFLEGVWHLEPKRLADYILDHACILHGGKAEDDLTVLVVKTRGNDS